MYYNANIDIKIRNEVKNIEIKYSVDMVRLKVKINNTILNHFMKTHLDLDPSVVYYNDFKYNKYRHNWIIEQEPPTFENEVSGDVKITKFGQAFSYWLGFHQNSENVGDNHYLVVEYNPNKCVIYGLLEVILRAFFSHDGVIVASLDIAMDFEVNINRLIIDKHRKQVYKLYDNGGDDKTHYLGKGDGRLKIYNKARELGIDGDLTRYEVSKKISMTIKEVVSSGYQFQCEIPPLSTIDETVVIDDSSLYCQYWAVVNGFPIEQLSRIYKTKIRDILKTTTILHFEKEKISSTIRQYFQGYSELLIKH